MTAEYVHYYQLKDAQGPRDVIGPVAVTVVTGSNGPKYMEHWVDGPVVRQSWLMPMYLNAG